jgi:hypothetical protein
VPSTTKQKTTRSGRARPARRIRGRPAGGNVRSWRRSDGDIGFAIRFYDQFGVRQRVRCGLASEGWSRERAQILLDQHLELVRTGRYVPPSDEQLDPEDSDPLFGDFACAVIAEHAITVEEKTREFNDNMLRNHLLPEFEDLRLSEITLERIQLFRRRRIELMRHIRSARDRGVVLRGPDNRPLKLAEKTINHEIAVLRFILAEAVRRRSIAVRVNEAVDRQPPRHRPEENRPRLARERRGAVAAEGRVVGRRGRPF